MRWRGQISGEKAARATCQSQEQKKWDAETCQLASPMHRALTSIDRVAIGLAPAKYSTIQDEGRIVWS